MGYKQLEDPTFHEVSGPWEVCFVSAAVERRFGSRLVWVSMDSEGSAADLSRHDNSRVSRGNSAEQS